MLKVVAGSSTALGILGGVVVLGSLAAGTLAAQATATSAPAAAAPGSRDPQMPPALIVSPPADAVAVEKHPPLDGTGNFTIASTSTWADVAAMTTPENVPRGTVTMFTMRSEETQMFPGVAGPYTRNVWVYVPAGYVPGTILPLMIDHDGRADAVIQSQLIVVMDNLIAPRISTSGPKMPVMSNAAWSARRLKKRWNGCGNASKQSLGGEMNRREFIKAGTTLAMAPAVLTRAQSPQVIDPAPPRLPAAGADGWVSLLNGRDLSGWYTMLQRSGKGVAEEQRMILMEEEMLHIMGNEEGKFPAEGGYLATNQEFANVRIRVEYRWGVKRHAPRYTPKRDNGLLYGLVGPDRVWPSCVECQIEEGDVGDFFLLGGVRGVQSNHNAGLFGEGINPLTGWPRPGDPGFRGAGASRAGGAPGAGAAAGAGSAQGAGGAQGAAAAPGPAAGRGAAPPAEPTSGRFIKDGNFELLDQWNTVEVIWQGDRAAHIVNGRTVNVATRLQQPDPQNPGQFIPLTRGKIAIEIEYAEIWFRRIEVKAI